MRLSKKTVETIQQRLTSVGLPVGPIDGAFGPVTKAAVEAFQKRAGLVVDGMPGPITQGALADAVGGLANVSGPVRVETSHAIDWPRQRDCVAFYGYPGRNQTRVKLPFAMKLAWNTGVEINSMTLHEKVADSASRCFERIADAYSAKKRAEIGIDLFGGSLNVRKMRGGSAWSMHSWGIAIDFDPARNRLRWKSNKARLAAPDAEKFWRIWEDEGWVSLGRARNMDWMHIQAARL